MAPSRGRPNCRPSTRRCRSRGAARARRTGLHTGTTSARKARSPRTPRSPTAPPTPPAADERSLRRLRGCDRHGPRRLQASALSMIRASLHVPGHIVFCIQNSCARTPLSAVRFQGPMWLASHAVGSSHVPGPCGSEPGSCLSAWPRLPRRAIDPSRPLMPGRIARPARPATGGGVLRPAAAAPQRRPVRPLRRAPCADVPGPAARPPPAQPAHAAAPP